MDDLPKVSLRLEEVQLLISRNIESIAGSVDDVSSQSSFKRTIADTKRLINESEALPRLLDPHLQWYIDKICAAYLKLKNSSNGLSYCTELAGLVLTLAKVRGYKFVATFFSTDVYLFPDILALLQDENLRNNIEESYFLLLWLSNLVLVPFPLNSILNSLDVKIFAITNKFLTTYTSASKTQILCLSLQALLLTRSDGTTLIDTFTNGVLKEWIRLDNKSKLSHLMIFNQILKRASSAEAVKFAQKIHHDVVLYEMSLLVINDASNTNTINIKYLFKVASKITRFYINLAEWDIVADYVDSIVYVCTAMKDRLDMSLREHVAKSMSKMVSDLFVKSENYANQLITYMLQQLHVKLPEGQYVNELQIEMDTNSIPIYHTILLFCGFLAMSKSLATENVPVYLSIIHQTSFISFKSTGLYQCSQVRDASCFCMWALIKNITSEAFSYLLDNYFEALSNFFLDSICIALFDEDYTIRRCGTAVLQEFSGRLGSTFFPLFLKQEIDSEIGKFSIQFVELFGNKSVGSLAESHKLMHHLVSMGIPKEMFIEQLMVEIELDFCPFLTKVIAAAHLSDLFLNSNSGDFSIESHLKLDRILERLVAGLLQLNYGALYALSELHKAKSLSSEVALNINSIVCGLSFSIHNDRIDKGEALLNWYVAELNFNPDYETRTIFPTVIEISRLNYNSSLVLLLQQLLSLIPILNNSNFDDISSQIRLGNHLLAKSICCHTFCLEEFNQLVKIVLDKSVDAQTRAYLVAEFGKFINEPEARQPLMLLLSCLLDDYSVSAQGDIGLLIRTSCIDLIIQYPFIILENRCEILSKLIRIAGETLDKLRLSAFRCLCLMENEERYINSYLKYNSDYALYFRDYFDFIASNSFEAEYGESFWTGIVLSAGASVAGSNLINLAMGQVLIYLETNEQASACLDILLKLLKIPTGKTGKTLSNREKKVIAATLSVFVRVFDSAIKLPTSFDSETLFIRCYNLHINTVHMARISLVIKIFQHLSCDQTSEGLAKKSKMRLYWLAKNSPKEVIRLLASDAIFEIILELEPHNSIVIEYESAKGRSNDLVLEGMKSILGL